METLLPRVENIKLVIWDLDETFWQGTLSEEGVTSIPENIDLVKKLSKRGIINSIVSKNDFNTAKAQLQKIGIWEYFVFPAIDWRPKGMLVSNIIENCQLRSTNVLFLDDNHSNLEEAKFYNPNIHAHFPDFIPNILGHEAFAGKDDNTLSRLQQYKILEKKHEAQKSYDDNLQFLRASGIQIELINDLSSYADRIHELLQRTNQLNFTKIRLTKDETIKLIENPKQQTALIKAKDNFGNYGMVGFYSIDPKDKKLHHFVFSCRVLNLGIPQYIYAKLNFPDLDIIPEVAETLDSSQPDWITEVAATTSTVAQKHTSTREMPQKSHNWLFRGPCNYKQTLFYLSNSGVNITQETNYVANNLPVSTTHTVSLLNAITLTPHQKEQISAIPDIPFFDKRYFDTAISKQSPDCMVMALETDYTQHIYRHKKSGVNLPLGAQEGVLTDPADHSKLLEYFHKRGATLFSQSSLDNFKRDFDHLGLITPEQFLANLRQIRKWLPKEKHLILMNAPNTTGPQKERTNRLNQIVDEFVNNHHNTHLLDLRKLDDEAPELHETSTKFNRKTYLDIASVLLEMPLSVSPKKQARKISKWLIWKNEARMQYLETKTFLRKTIWLRLKHLNFILATEFLTEVGAEELLLSFYFPLA
ncbi:hypothetical protein DN752_09150 [Echinicola strongylocentroti]|uniref:HAD-IIIC family phosphatase n=1 Tax=Echinicola strongylocentroti TaxID=1795355 RepID=A0A2Z4IH65_9BACT|nr:HAD-IIIC family phosphatase [Echinicola strongylocentroti]AWW30275.1 hypothetical protein DN752_09150 [Echinicola strongylocentroti]